MAETMKKRIQDYYDNGDTRCPACDSSDIEAGTVSVKVGTLDQREPVAKCSTTCRACGFDWTESFKVEFGTEE